jgi:hypothetical protein
MNTAFKFGYFCAGIIVDNEVTLEITEVDRQILL